MRVAWRTTLLMLSVSASRPTTTLHMPLVLKTPAFSPFSLLALPSISFMIVSGVISITFNLDIISWNDHRQSPPRITSLNLVLETTPSSHRTSSPTSMLMAPPRTSTPLSRILLRLSSLVTLLSPASTISGLSPEVARLSSSHSSSPPPSTPMPMSATPTLTLMVSRMIDPDTTRGSVPTVLLTGPSSRETSGRSTVVISRAMPTSMTAPALIMASPPTSVRISPNGEITVIRSLMDLLISFQRPLRKDLPLRWLLAGTRHRYRFQGRNTYSRGFPLRLQRRHSELRFRSG